MIGNGTTVLLLGAGFLTYGLMKNDYRAYATASGLLESLALSGIYVQVLKRSTGRESPFIARENGNSGGAWNPFLVLVLMERILLIMMQCLQDI